MNYESHVIWDRNEEDKKLYEKVRKYCLNEGLPVSEYIRLAVRKYYEKNNS